AVDAAGRVDFLHRELDAAIDADACGGGWAGEGREIADADRLIGCDGGLGETTCDGGGAGRRQRLTTRHRHCDFLPRRVSILPKACCVSCSYALHYSFGPMARKAACPAPARVWDIFQLFREPKRWNWGLQARRRSSPAAARASAWRRRGRWRARA